MQPSSHAMYVHICAYVCNLQSHEFGHNAMPMHGAGNAVRTMSKVIVLSGLTCISAGDPLSAMPERCQ